MKKIEMHCHSNRSDGKNTLDEVLAEAQRLNLDFLALTDHDVIASQGFQRKLRDSGIKTCDSVEISARNFDTGKSLHLVSYAKNFAASLGYILNNTLHQKKEKNRGQIEKLGREFQFEGDFTEFQHYILQEKKRNPDTANGFDIASFFMRFPGNRKKAEKALADVEQKDGTTLEEQFFLECLKRGGKLYEIFGSEIPEYEPRVEQTVQEVVQKSGGIVSLAHPNVTWNSHKGGISEFESVVGDYVEKGVNAIEINMQASPEWVKTILETRKKFGLLLTFGSDCHKIGYDGRDKKHASIGQKNPHISEDLVERNFGEFLERVS